MALHVDARRGEIATGAVLLAVGLFFVWQASGLDLGTVGLPGPGFFPLVLGLLLALAAGAVIVRVVRLRGERETTGLGHVRVILTFVALLLVAPLFERLGAVVTLGAFAAAVVVIVGRVHWLAAVIGSAAAMAVAWYFFKVLLGVQLPAGIFG